MPLQNRMLPNGELVAQSWRGTFMGNRGGRIHDPETQTLQKRRSVSRRWITCVLDFKNRQRKVMGDGYTEVFFLDEVSALAAGHRPCFECRRQDALNFQRCWQEGFNLSEKPGADVMDVTLQKERTAENVWIEHEDIPQLPHGTMVQVGNEAFAIHDGEALIWSGSGYLGSASIKEPAKVLTSPSILTVLSQGYEPRFHPSAGLCGGGDGNS